LRSLYGRAGVDPFSRLSRKASNESLERYWRSMVYATYDQNTGLALVRIRAFAPQDAFVIATNLIDLTNQVVNVTGRLSRADSVRYAQMQVDEAQRQMDGTRARLTALRTEAGTIDPSKTSVPDADNLAQTLRQSLNVLEARYTFLQSQ